MNSQLFNSSCNNAIVQYFNFETPSYSISEPFFQNFFGRYAPRPPTISMLHRPIVYLTHNAPPIYLTHVLLIREHVSFFLCFLCLFIVIDQCFIINLNTYTEGIKKTITIAIFIITHTHCYIKVQF